MSRFYTEVALNQAQEGILNLPDFQSGVYIPPMRYLKTHHLPTVRGATTLPPAGRFATPKDLFGDLDDGSQPVPLVKHATIAATLLAAFYLFLPRVV
jgi:hypothetical protein